MILHLFSLFFDHLAETTSRVCNLGYGSLLSEACEQLKDIRNTMTIKEFNHPNSEKHKNKNQRRKLLRGEGGIVDGEMRRSEIRKRRRRVGLNDDEDNVIKIPQGASVFTFRNKTIIR